MKKTAETKFSYDETPYASYPFLQTNPSSIYSIAKLFGVDAVHPSKARILELGCASGNNILAIASIYPGSKCVGIDLSEVQINEGKQRIKEIGIKNLELVKASITDIDETDGKFDYIICHGVFSWVPKKVQESILAVCQKNLTSNGVAYISYNTMPGWASVRAIREMMQYHTKRFPDLTQKAAQSRHLLKFIADGFGTESSNPYAEIIKNELQLLNNQSDYYLLHDHLEENNNPCYFHEFIDLAGEHNMQYLAETSLAIMYTGNLPKNIADVLATSNDIVRTEQYMDFVYNRRFRSTLLCHNDRIIKRNLTADVLLDKFFTSNFKPQEDLSNYDYKTKTNFTFVSANNITVTTNDKLVIAMIDVLSEAARKPINPNKITKLILKKFEDKKVESKLDAKQIMPNVLGSLLRFVFTGGIVIHSDEGAFTTTVSEFPKTSDMVAYQAKNQNWITSQKMEMIQVNIFDKAFLPLLNGKNDIKKIIKLLIPLFEKDELTISDSGNKITDPKIIEEKLSTTISDTLKKYASLGLLVS